MHRVSRDILESYGKPIREVALELNERLTGMTVYSDGWVVDHPWMITLFHKAALPMAFSVSALEMILTEQQMDIWSATRDDVERELGLSRHRASHDAKMIQETFLRSQAATV